MKACPVCCKEFEPVWRGSRQCQKYCSKACFLARGKVKLVPREQLNMAPYLRESPVYCCQCGVLYIRYRYDQLTCGSDCSIARNQSLKQLVRKARAAHRLETTRKPRPCERCQVEFKPNRPCQLYCGRKCQNADRNARVRVMRQTKCGDLS